MTETLSIDPAPPAVASHPAFGDELRADADALLQSVRRRLTGTEIAHCEAVVGLRPDIININLAVIDSLRIQFSREIAEAKAAHNFKA